MIVLVSGIPRSGTAMMMQILEGGGFTALKDDDFLTPNGNNPEGYYEIKDVRHVVSNPNLRAEVEKAGHPVAIKALSNNLPYVPFAQRKHYKVIWMERDPACVQTSLELIRAAQPTIYIPNLQVTVPNVLDELKTFPHIKMQYEQILAYRRESIEELAKFLDWPEFAKEIAITRIKPELCHHKPKGE